ncbi:NUMOD4 protein, partial [Vibrio phage 1.063.O._10N.261.45.C7]
MYDKFYEVFLPQPLEWRAVKDYEGLYEVSNYGNVRSLDRERTWFREDIQAVCTRVFKGINLTNKLKDTGYLEVHLRDEERHNYWTVHKLVSEAFHKDLDLPVVDHKNDNKTCNFVWNLQRCTVKFNTTKAVANGQLVSGNTRYTNKLSETLKDSVRTLLAEGVSIRKIERDLPISQRSIARIRDGLI